MTTKFDGEVNTTGSYNISQYALNIKNRIESVCNSLTASLVDQKDRFTNVSLNLRYKITVPDNTLDVNGALGACLGSINSNLNPPSGQSKFVAMASSVSKQVGRTVVRVSMKPGEKCCNSSGHFCCPSGHLLSNVHSGAAVCCKLKLLFLFECGYLISINFVLF